MVFFSNKNIDFTFQLNVNNSTLGETEARLVIEGKNGNISHPVTIENDGYSHVSFKPKDILNEGKVFLEVITKDFYAKAWEDNYIFENQKLSQVETYYQRGLQKLKVTSLNENKKQKYINTLLEHTAKRYNLTTKEKISLKRNTSNLL
jgi:hypothetical protein